MRKLRVVMIVQARMGATRLPGKPLKTVLNRSLLSYQIERLKRAQTVDQIVIATTTAPHDLAIVGLCQNEGVQVFRGSEEDVLERYYQAAKLFDADIVVRVTGDCPLSDPAVIDRVVRTYLQHFPVYDYVTNVLPGRSTYPRGLDLEVFSFKGLERAVLEAKKPEEREHVTPFFYEHPHLFHLKNVEYSSDESHHRWTVDTAEDLCLVEHIIKALYPMKPTFDMEDILKLLQEHPEWVEINRHIKQKPLR